MAEGRGVPGGAAVPPGYEPAVRFGCFAVVLLLMAAREALAPRRRLTVRWPLRWASPLGLVAVDTLAVRFLVPLGAFGTALLAADRGWGLFHNVALPGWLAVVLSVVALDFVINLQHVLFQFHYNGWRFNELPGQHGGSVIPELQ